MPTTPESMRLTRTERIVFALALVATIAASYARPWGTARVPPELCRPASVPATDPHLGHLQRCPVAQRKEVQA